MDNEDELSLWSASDAVAALQTKGYDVVEADGYVVLHISEDARQTRFSDADLDNVMVSSAGSFIPVQIS